MPTREAAERGRLWGTESSGVAASHRSMNAWSTWTRRRASRLRMVAPGLAASNARTCHVNAPEH
eukprot:4022183-Prymnesium_polylepis.1